MPFGVGEPFAASCFWQPHDRNGGRPTMTADIRDYLAQFRGQDVLYLPNPGNAGDSVMSSATYQLLDAAGIRYHVPHLGTLEPAGKILLYGGGGNLYEGGRHSYRTLERVH